MSYRASDDVGATNAAATTEQQNQHSTPSVDKSLTISLYTRQSRNQEDGERRCAIKFASTQSDIATTTTTPTHDNIQPSLLPQQRSSTKQVDDHNACKHMMKIKNPTTTAADNKTTNLCNIYSQSCSQRQQQQQQQLSIDSHPHHHHHGTTTASTSTTSNSPTSAITDCVSSGLFNQTTTIQAGTKEEYHHHHFVENASTDLEENECTEFKMIYTNDEFFDRLKEALRRTLNAFLNMNGGSIYFGITDEGIVKGLTLHGGSGFKDDICLNSDAVMSGMFPQVDLKAVQYRIRFASVWNAELNRAIPDQYIVIVSVAEDPHLDEIGVHFTDSSCTDAYMRASASSIRIHHSLIVDKLRHANVIRTKRNMQTLFHGNFAILQTAADHVISSAGESAEKNIGDSRVKVMERTSRCGFQLQRRCQRSLSLNCRREGKVHYSTFNNNDKSSFYDHRSSAPRFVKCSNDDNERSVVQILWTAAQQAQQERHRKSKEYFERGETITTSHSIESRRRTPPSPSPHTSLWYNDSDTALSRAHPLGYNAIQLTNAAIVAMENNKNDVHHNHQNSENRQRRRQNIIQQTPTPTPTFISNPLLSKTNNISAKGLQTATTSESCKYTEVHCLYGVKYKTKEDLTTIIPSHVKYCRLRITDANKCIVTFQSDNERDAFLRWANATVSLFGIKAIIVNT
jgi:hypothetical protein